MTYYKRSVVKHIKLTHFSYESSLWLN